LPAGCRGEVPRSLFASLCTNLCEGFWCSDDAADADQLSFKCYCIQNRIGILMPGSAGDVDLRKNAVLKSECAAI
ncbi:hypothetical protein PanWU01x14_276630, partial [Parasponia andersonii]